MAAQDTILVAAVNPGAGPTAGTVTASGDSLSIRSFPDANKAYLENIIRMGTTAGFVQVRSPRLHDNVRGIRVTPAESPSVYSLPAQAEELLYPQDTLICELSGGAAETDIAAILVYYENLPGSNGTFVNWSDISGMIKHVKPITVAVTSSATVGAWSDTVITTTEDLTVANTDYAVLGYSSNAAMGVIGVKGTNTGNLRVSGPGATTEFPTTEWFIRQSDKRGTPHIPVFNAANKNNTFVSVAAATASVADTVELICAELSSNITGT